MCSRVSTGTWIDRSLRAKSIHGFWSVLRVDIMVSSPSDPRNSGRMPEASEQAFWTQVTVGKPSYSVSSFENWRG